jgi:glutaredoxin
VNDRRRSLLGVAALVLGVGAATRWWAGRRQAGLGGALAARAAPGDIRLLSSTTCAYCTAARRWLQQHRVPFGECFIENDAACAAEFEAVRAPGTPVVVVRGRPQLGFDAQRVLDALDRG